LSAVCREAAESRSDAERRRITEDARCFRRLVQLAVPIVPELTELLDSADLFTEYAVALRYPDEWRETEPEEVQNLMAISKQFAAVLLPKLA
jgi:hypothetical protein